MNFEMQKNMTMKNYEYEYQYLTKNNEWLYEKWNNKLFVSVFQINIGLSFIYIFDWYIYI